MWPNVIFVEFLARHMVRPVSSLDASSRSHPPWHFRVAYLAPASGMCGPSVASGGGQAAFLMHLAENLQQKLDCTDLGVSVASCISQERG